MRKGLLSLLVIAILLSMCACREDMENDLSTTSDNSDSYMDQGISINTLVEGKAKSIPEQIDVQLQGIWISHSSDDVYSKWTFYNGNYVVDTYVSGNKLDNSTIGIYAIGSEAIHTITIDQENAVEGHIPYTFTDNNLELHGATGDLVKE